MTTAVREMLRDSPVDIELDEELLAASIEALLSCAQACTSCADACLAEDDVDRLRRCITTNLGCSDLCSSAARILSRHTDPHPAMTRLALETAITAARECAEECESHAAHHDHCRVCAEECRRCVEVCSKVLDAFAVHVADG